MLIDVVYAPRTFCYHPREYGRLKVAQFKIGASDSSETHDRLLVAAIVQHRIAIEIRQCLPMRGMTQREYAAQTGTSPDRMTRILTGHKVMTVVDIAQAYWLLGQDMAAIDVNTWVDLASGNDRGVPAAQKALEHSAFNEARRKLRQQNTRPPTAP